MGHPKKQKRKYSKPKLPYEKDRLEKEKKLKKDYGLKRKKEIWKMMDKLREYRRRAREVQAESIEKGEQALLEKMDKLGILTEKDADLEDVLSLGIEDLMERRLQTLLLRKNLADTPKQARQLIVHKHVKVNNKVVNSPGYLIPKKLENSIETTKGGKNE